MQPGLPRRLQPCHRYELGGEVHHPPPLCATLSLTAMLCACAPQEIQQQVNGSLQVNSTTVAAGAIPDKCGCKGPGISPHISWTEPPPGTQSSAPIMDGKAPPVGHLHRPYFVPLPALDLPSDKRELTEGLPRQPL